MAAQTSFRQACPSCEAMVPIKDSSLVGKKVDCPKCKYRFVVEEPGDSDEDTKTRLKTRPDGAKGKGGTKTKTRPTRTDDQDAPKKKKGGNNMILIVGGGLGLVAVVGLIIGAIVIFGGNSSQTPSPGNQQAKTSPSGPGTGVSGVSTTTGPGTPDPNATSPANAAGADAGEGMANVTNLLPSDTQAVYNFNMSPLRDSTLGQSVFVPGGLRTELFRDALGLPVERMTKFVRGESLKAKWSFNVIQMNASFGVKADALKPKLGGQKGPKSPIKGFEYFVVSANEVVDSLGAIDLAGLLGSAASAAPAPSGQSLAWHVYDDRTVVIAEIGQLEQFLTAGRKPTPQTVYNGASGAGTETPGSGPGFPNMPGKRGGPGGPGGSAPMIGGPGGSAPAISGLGGPGGGPPLPAPIGPGGSERSGDPAAGGQSDAQYSNKPTYLTVKPELKRLLDAMEEQTDTKLAVIFSAGAIDLESSNPKIVDAIRSTTGLGASLPLPTIVAAGAGLHVFSETRLTAVAQLELKREDDARKLDESLRTIAFPIVARNIGNWLGGITIDTGENQGGTPGGPNFPGMDPRGPGGGAPFPGGVMGPGMPGGGGLKPGAAAGGPAAGMPLPPAGGGSMMPSGPRGGVGGAPFPGVTQPGGPDSSKPATTSTLTSSYGGKVVYIKIDVEINKTADEKLRRTVENQVVRLKGVTDVQAMSQPRWHELAATANAIRSQKLALRGTYPIAGEGQTFGSSTFVSRTPNQRVSFMVDLLPFLGKQEIYDQIDKKKPWRDEQNLRAAANWIPQFINPKYPQKSWHVRLPSLPDSDLGATHFVGLSGVGMDSAEYNLSNPALAKKAGLFNYNTETRLDDVKDGLSNTIYLIQVPPTYQRPWIAGGGATIMGVPEKNSAAPFMAMQANGKRGTYALMADGSVRWISDTIPDATFQALVTKAGEDTADDLNSHSQIVPSVGGSPAPVKPTAKPATGGAVAVPPVGNWKESISSEGGYSIMLPTGGMAINTKQSVQIPGGPKLEFTLFGTDFGDKGMYMTSYVEMPPGGPQLSLDQRFEGAKQGILANVPGGKFVKEEKLTLDNKYEGREFTIEVAAQGTMRARLYLVANRLYQVIVGGPGNLSTSADAKKFLDSFKLTGK